MLYFDRLLFMTVISRADTCWSSDNQQRHYLNIAALKRSVDIFVKIADEKQTRMSTIRKPSSGLLFTSGCDGRALCIKAN